MAANGLLYLTSQEGDIHVLRTGATPELIQGNPMGEVLMATPAISNGMLFIRGAHNLFAVSAPADG